MSCGESAGPTAPTADFTRKAPPVARVAVIYSNFAPHLAFDTDPFHGWTINGFQGPGIGEQAVSQQFTPSGDYVFTDAEVAVVSISGPASIRVFLQANANGLPGSVIEEMSVSGFGSVPAVVVARSGHFPILRKGTPYWLTLAAGGSGVLAGWNWNSIGDVSTAFASTQGGSPAGPWGAGRAETRGAFAIEGKPLDQAEGHPGAHGRHRRPHHWWPAKPWGGEGFDD
jgi:hypothetical protein